MALNVYALDDPQAASSSHQVSNVHLFSMSFFLELIYYTCQHHLTPTTHLRSLCLLCLVKMSHLSSPLFLLLPDLLWVLPLFIILLLTCTSQTVKIFICSHPTSPIPSVPPRSLMLRGCSPILMFDLLPPNLAAFFNSTQMQETQQLSGYYPIQVADSDIISITSSESENEKVSIKSWTWPCSLELILETQVVCGIKMDILVHPDWLDFYICIAHSDFPYGPDVGKGGQVHWQA